MLGIPVPMGNVLKERDFDGGDDTGADGLSVAAGTFKILRDFIVDEGMPRDKDSDGLSVAAGDAFKIKMSRDFIVGEDIVRDKALGEDSDVSLQFTDISLGAKVKSSNLSFNADVTAATRSQVGVTLATGVPNSTDSLALCGPL